MKKYIFFLLCCLFLTRANSFAQVLNGKVKRENGNAASKVSVAFLNNANKVITNADGGFGIKANVLPDTLVFSSPDFETYKILVTEKNINDPNFEVVLLNKRSDHTEIISRPSSRTLSEIVVTAYGIKKQSKELGYSTTKINTDELKQAKVSNIATGLAAKVSGLTAAVDGSSYKSDKKLNTVDNISPLKNRALTAGEVNDFYKWKMWDDLSENEFRQWSTYWEILPKKRFSVQLQNKNYVAIINQPLFLIDKKTGITIWQALTDNTGKAELWASFNGKNDGEAEYIIKDAEGNAITDPVPFEKAGINHLKTDKNCDVRNAVDIAFVVDATGSMEDEIKFLKFEMEDVIRKTFDNYNHLDLKVASVFYRDRGDEYITRYIDFQTELLKVLNFVKLQHAGGGGDEPEAVDSAIDVALNSLNWRKEARARLMFLFLDAPPHDYAKKNIYKLIEKAAAMGVRIIPVACSGSGKSNEYLLRSMALATNGTYVFLTDHSGVGNKHTEPTTDSYDVELLNDLLQRIIQQFTYVQDCPGTVIKNDQPLIKQPENLAQVKLYPNPTQGNTTLLSMKKIKEVFIADFTGKLLLKLTAPIKDKWQINISNYPSGTYLVKYITVDDKWGTEKLLLIH